MYKYSCRIVATDAADAISPGICNIGVFYRALLKQLIGGKGDDV